MASISTCRLCFSQVNQKHCISLFSSSSLKTDLPGRFSRLAQVPVEPNDGLSWYLCRNCRGKFLTLETKLQEFRQKAQSTCSPQQAAPCSRKRVKATAGTDGVSPHTALARPKSKRPTTSRVLFPETLVKNIPEQQENFPEQQENIPEEQGKHATLTQTQRI